MYSFLVITSVNYMAQSAVILGARPIVIVMIRQGDDFWVSCCEQGVSRAALCKRKDCTQLSRAENNNTLIMNGIFSPIYIHPCIHAVSQPRQPSSRRNYVRTYTYVRTGSKLRVQHGYKMQATALRLADRPSNSRPFVSAFVSSPQYSYYYNTEELQIESSQSLCV